MHVARPLNVAIRPPKPPVALTHLILVVTKIDTKRSKKHVTAYVQDQCPLAGEADARLGPAASIPWWSER